MKRFILVLLLMTANASFAVPQAPTVSKKFAKKNSQEDLKKLAREIEVLADWKDLPAFLQMSKRILKLYELDDSKSTFSATTELKDLADIYRDGTVPPEMFYLRAKKLAQSIQTYLSVSN